MSCLYIATSKFGPVIRSGRAIRSQRKGNAREIVQRFALSASMVVVAAPVMLVVERTVLAPEVRPAAL